MLTDEVQYCDIWGNEPANYVDRMEVAYLSPENHNAAIDPRFLVVSGEDPFAWDFHLDDGSLLIDAGDPSEGEEDPGLDPDGSVSDIGAYGGRAADEFDIDGDGFTEWWLPGEYDPVTSPDTDCNDLDAAVYHGVECPVPEK